MENIEEYGIEIKLSNQRKLMESLTKLEKKMLSLNKKVYEGIEAQQKDSIRRTTQRLSKENKAAKTLLTERLKTEQKLSDRIEKEGFSIVEKALRKRESAELKQAERVAKVRKSKIKEVEDYRKRIEARQKSVETGKFKQHVKSLTGSSQQKGTTNKITPETSMFSMSDRELEMQKRQQQYMKSMEAHKERQRQSQEKLNARVQEAIRLRKIEGKELSSLYIKDLRRATSNKEITMILQRHNREYAKTTKHLKHQSYLTDRMKLSSRQMVGNYVSAFAAVGALVSATRSGQDMEGATSAINVMSDGSKEAAENLKYVREEAYRLGKPLKASAKVFSQLLASKGNLSTDQIKDVFSSTQEMAVVLGMNSDETGRAMTAISQMMAKGKISSEELRQQLSESGMANAFKEMVLAAQDTGQIDKSLGLVEARQEFEELLKKGAVISEKIMPRFAERLREVAAPELANKLKSNTVALGRFLDTALVDAGNTFFVSGWGEGFTELLNTSSDSLKELEPLLQALGKIFGSLAKGIATLIRSATPVLKMFGDVLKGLTDIMGDWTGLIAVLTGAGGLALFNSRVNSLSGGLINLKKVASPIAMVFKKWLIPLAAVIESFSIIEDYMAQFVWKDRITANYDPREDKDSKYYDTNFKALPEGFKSKSIDEMRSSIGDTGNTPQRRAMEAALWDAQKDYAVSQFGKIKEFFSPAPTNLNQKSEPYQIIVHHQTIIDGEEIATSMTKTDGFKNGVAQTIYPIMQGGQ